MTTKPSALDTLLEAAILAPSGDNTQAWRFTVNRGERTILLGVDPSRDSSPMNAGQRMARIAVGAAVENMVRTATENHWEHETTISADQVEFRLTNDYAHGTISREIRDRATNRKQYHADALSQDLLDRLQKSTNSDCSVSWIVDSELKESLCNLIGRADAVILSSKIVRDAFLAKVRFDRPALSVVEEGLSLGSLEISWFQQMALRAMRVVPNVALQAGGASRLFKKAAMNLATSASGFCLVTVSSDSPNSDFLVGRLLERSWLKLTELDLAVQPMMSLVVLRNMLENGADAVKHSLAHPQAEEILNDFYLFSREIADGKPSAILRFGLAEKPSVRTGRLDITQSIVESS